MIELTGITWDHPRGYAPLQGNAQVRGVRVNWERRSLKDFGDASLVDLAKRFDLLVLDHPHAGEAAAGGSLLPLDDLLPAEEIEGIRLPANGPSFESYRYAGHLWALPVDAACQVASFRRDVVQAAAVPSNWDEAFRLAEDLRRSGQSMGLALCPTDAMCSFLTLCAQMGDGPGDSRWILNETAVAALARLEALRDACHAECLEWNPIDLYEHMAGGGPVVYCPLAFGYNNYSRAGATGYPLGFCSIPGGIGALLGGAGIGISAHSSYPAEAARYAAWICGADIQSGNYLCDGGQPAHGAAWGSPCADELCGGFFSGTIRTLHNAFVRPRRAGWPEFQEALGDMIHTHLAARRSRDETCAAMRGLHHQFFNS